MKKFIFSFFLALLLLGFNACQANMETVPDGENVGSFSSYSQLEDYIKSLASKDGDRYYFNSVLEFEGTPESAVDSTTDDQITYDSGERSHSQTNNQVEGIFEADTIITDGYYIYIVSGNRFLIVSADSLDIVYEYEVEEIYFSGLYVYEDKVVVLGNYWLYTYDETVREDSDQFTSEGSETTEGYSYAYSYSYGTKVFVFDVSDMENIVVSRELNFDSAYLTESRMIDDEVYLILNNYSLGYYFDEARIIPEYYDSAVMTEMEKFQPSQIYFMPNDNQEMSYLIFSVFSVEDNEAAKTKAYLGSSYQIYMSQDNIYTTVYRYLFDEELDRYDAKTFIMRFSIEDGVVEYQAMAKIDGSPLNQFSMDEYNGVFRIAVTDYDFSQETAVFNNSVYLLSAESKDEMEILSSLSGLGKPGERIYAVRYMEDEAYVVTFVNTDPLYKLDLSDPLNPAVLGELEEEGVSDYLHPIFTDLAIGIGRQAEENEYGWTNFIGVKVATYDLSGNNPENIETYLVEGEYSYSRASYDHKAFIYYEVPDEDYLLFAIPISVYYEDYYRYAQKLLVFKVWENGDLELAAELEHMGNNTSYFDQIERAVMIENYIYTLSYSQIQVFNMDDEFNFVDKVIINETYYFDYAINEEPMD